jgi:hypothetical protein
MAERRKEQRQRLLKAGTIAFNRAAGITCTIRNMSVSGACLGVASPLGIPDDFTLVIDSDHVQRACHVKWRREKQIGVAFL